MALAMVWVSRIFVISLEMIAPGIIAQRLGERWGIPWLVLLGFVVGIGLGLTHLILLTNATAREGRSAKKTDDTQGE